jgi:hypothetical protein
MLEMLQWLETTRLAELVSQSLYGFPVLVAFHLLGLGLSVGMLLWVDLRLIGVVMRDVPASELYRRLAPWMLSGFTVMFVSGGMLFAGYATAAAGNTWFRLKLVALCIAAVNALVYHVWTERRLRHVPDDRAVPLGARTAGIVSIAVWAVVVFAGRMMSYTMF